MRREVTGHDAVTSTTGEAVRAFVPAPLPPDPPVMLEGELQALHERALLACGRLDGISSLNGIKVLQVVEHGRTSSPQLEPAGDPQRPGADRSRCERLGAHPNGFRAEGRSGCSPGALVEQAWSAMEPEAYEAFRRQLDAPPATPNERLQRTMAATRPWQA